MLKQAIRVAIIVIVAFIIGCFLAGFKPYNGLNKGFSFKNGCGVELVGDPGFFCNSER